MLVAQWMLSASSSAGIGEIHIQALRTQSLNRFVDGNRGPRTEVLQMHQVHYVCSVQVSVSMCCFIPASLQTDGKSWGACYIAEATPHVSLIWHATKSSWSVLLQATLHTKNQVELTWLLLLAAAVKVHT
jgi:hypothetical protein